jgi:RNA polymerase sigma-70 factor (ECF subfamily)
MHGMRPAKVQLSLVPRGEPRTATELSDAQLVADVLAGDARAKKELYLRHVRYIAGMCARLLRSVQHSEDVVQDTFVLAFAKLPSLREPEAFRGWLAAIAVSQVHRRLSRQRWLKLWGLEGQSESGLEQLAREDLSAEARSELAALDRVLQSLPPGQRIAWMLRHVEDEPLEQVAAACRCSLATAKRWIAAASERVKRQVAITTGEAGDD